MAGPSSTKSSSKTQRFNDYIDGLRNEFHQHSNLTLATTSTRSNRFDIFLGGLKGEFELMALEIESLQKERDKFEAAAQALTEELRNFRLVERSQKTPRITPPSLSKTLARTPSVSRSVLPSKKPSPSPPSQQARPRTQYLSTRPGPVSGITSARPLPTTSHRPKIPIVTRSQHRMSPPSPPLSLASTPVNSDSAAEQQTRSIIFNDVVEKELDVEVVHTLLHERLIRGVKFSQDGKYLAAGCHDGNAFIYTVETGTLVCVLRDLLPDCDGMTKVCFSPDGLYLATAGENGRIHFWKIRTKYIRNAFKGHTGVIHSLEFSLNGRHLVSASYDNTVRLWNLRDGAAKILTETNPILLDTPHYRSAVFSPDGKYVAASHRDGMIRIWCARTGQLVRRVKAYTYWVNDIAFMPHGTGLVSGRRDNTLRYWDMSSLATTRAVKDLHEYDSDIETLPEGTHFRKGRGTCVVAVAAFPDGRWVVSGTESSIRIWDTCNATTQCIITIGGGEFIEAVDVSSAGGHFASGDTGGMTIWRWKSVVQSKP